MDPKKLTLPSRFLLSFDFAFRYHLNHLYIIDVSQSVEHDHPRAFDFLRADLEHVDQYFTRQGVHTLGLRKTFDWVVKEPLNSGRKGGKMGTDEERHLKAKFGESEENQDQANSTTSSQSQPSTKDDDEVSLASDAPTITSASPIAHGPFAKIEIQKRSQGEEDHELMAKLWALMEERDQEDEAKAQQKEYASDASVNEESKDASTSDTLADSNATTTNSKPSSSQAHEDAVFKSSYIPRTLDEVYDPERDAEILNRGDGDQLIYAGVTGIGETGSKTQNKGSKSEKNKVENGKEAVAVEEEGEEEFGSDLDSEEGSGDEEEDGEGDGEGKDAKKKAPRGHRHEDRDAKKVSSML